MQARDNRKKKFLMIATVASMIGQFNMENINILLGMGFEVHVACNFYDQSVWSADRIKIFKRQLESLGIKEIQIGFSRNPYNISKIIAAYLEVRKLIKDQKYEALHCHTPVAALVARLAALNTNTRVIYTVHGFHFYKGAPLKNWMVYYPVEKICSYMTYILITINKEDYKLAKKNMRAKRVVYIPGVGIDLKKFEFDIENEAEKKKSFRTRLGCKENELMLISVGELSERKNHKIVIQALCSLKNLSFKYYIVGQGSLENYLKKMIETKGLSERVILLGFRNDVDALLHAADIFVFPSLQEGLPMALMEAMACGLPVVCSKIRGNVDLIDDEQYLFDPIDEKSVCERINSLLVMDQLQREAIGICNSKKVFRFSSNVVSNQMTEIYQSF